MAQMVESLLAFYNFFSFLGKIPPPIHKWHKWSNIWFVPYTDGSDGQIYGLHHIQMATKKNYFLCNEALFVAPGPGPGAR